MKGLESLLLKSVVLIALVYVTFANAQKAPQPVVVTNTAAQPVPTVAQGTTTVTGSVSVTNTPSVNVANTPNVNVTNTPSVNINSMPAVALGPGATVAVDPSTNVNTADVAARHIVRLIAYGSFSTGTSTVHATLLNGSAYTVPSGQRLVVNNISVAALVPSGQPGVYVAFQSSDLPAFVSYPEMHKAFTYPSGTTDLYVYNSTAPIYVDDGKTMSMDGGSNAGTVYVYAYFQGYLMDCGTGGCTQQ